MPTPVGEVPAVRCERAGQVGINGPASGQASACRQRRRRDEAAAASGPKQALEKHPAMRADDGLSRPVITPRSGVVPTSDWVPPQREIESRGIARARVRARRLGQGRLRPRPRASGWDPDACSAIAEYAAGATGPAPLMCLMAAVLLHVVRYLPSQPLVVEGNSERAPGASTTVPLSRTRSLDLRSCSSSRASGFADGCLTPTRSR